MRRACHREWRRTVRSPQGHSWNSWGNNGKRAVYSPKSAVDTNGCNESSLALHTLSRLLRFAHHCAKQRLNLRFKRLEGGMRRPRLRTQHNIAVCGKLMLIAMRQYSESTFHRIANHRVPHRFGDGQTQTPRRCRTGRGRRRAHHVMQHNIRVTDPTAAFEYGDKFAMVFQPLHFACESGGEGLAALGATTGEHGTTTLGGHTGTEAMGLGTLTLIRLIRTLHLKFLLLHFECPRERGRRYRHVSLKIVGKSMFKCQEIKGKRSRSSHGSPISSTEIFATWQLFMTFHRVFNRSCWQC